MPTSANKTRAPADSRRSSTGRPTLDKPRARKARRNVWLRELRYPRRSFREGREPARDRVRRSDLIVTAISFIIVIAITHAGGREEGGGLGRVLAVPRPPLKPHQKLTSLKTTLQKGKSSRPPHLPSRSNSSQAQTKTQSQTKTPPGAVSEAQPN